MGDARGIGCNDDQGGNDLQEEDDHHVHAGVSVGGLSQRQSRGDLND